MIDDFKDAHDRLSPQDHMDFSMAERRGFGIPDDDVRPYMLFRSYYRKDNVLIPVDGTVEDFKTVATQALSKIADLHLMEIAFTDEQGSSWGCSATALGNPKDVSGAVWQALGFVRFPEVARHFTKPECVDPRPLEQG